MKHPSEATLALHAGNDLGAFDTWRVRRHLRECEACQDEVAAYQAMREIARDLRETPEIAWNRLAAEMRANIRLGLAAGACVDDPAPAPEAAPVHYWPLFNGARALVACASLVTILATAWVVGRPAPGPSPALAEGIVVQRMAGGIQVGEGAQALRLMHGKARDVMYTVNAQGSMRARYVDPDTGYATINTVYAE
jgi:hypothetical protein